MINFIIFVITCSSYNHNHYQQKQRKQSNFKFKKKFFGRKLIKVEFPLIIIK